MGRKGLIVLDASAVLALLQSEPGSEQIEGVLGDCCISTVNFSEVASKLVERQLQQETIEQMLEPFAEMVVPLSSKQAICAGYFRAQTRHLGLSLGDRCCFALAIDLNATVLTADRAWAGLDVGVPVRVIR